jgi:NAD-dependent deacetylase
VREAGARPAGRRHPAEAARLRLAQARRVVALTGPGLDPGDAIPAFSECGTRFGGRSVAAVAAPGPFFEDPVAVWRWYDERRQLLAAVRPGAAHRALAGAERRAETFTLVTECVDGLHRNAGNRNVLELRGSIWQIHCTLCGLRSVNREVPIPMPPSCPICTGLARPGVVWQGEQVPRDLLVRSFEALRRCDVLIVAGSPSRLQPAAAFVAVARRAGAYIVEVAGARDESGSPADLLLVGDPGEILSSLVSEGR